VSPDVVRRCRRRAVVLAAAALAVGVGALFMRFNAPPGDYSPKVWMTASLGDLISYYLPMMELAASRVTALELPLWNPHMCSGLPLLATLQVGVFFPGNWLTWIWPAHVAIPVLMALESVLAGWLAAWMFRALGYDLLAASLGGLLYVFACVLGQTLWPPAVSTLVFVPWLVLCVQKLLEAALEGAPSARWFCALSVGAGLQVLAGFPQYLVYGYVAVFALVLSSLVERVQEGTPVARLGPGIAWAASALALGAGLAAVQLLPTLELAALSPRAAELSAAQIHYLTNTSPYTLGGLVPAAFDPSPGVISYHSGHAGGYLGLPTLLFGVATVVLAARRARTWVLLAAAIVTLVLSDGLLGAGAPAYRLLAEIPLFGSFRTPERLRFVAFLCWIALALGVFDAVRGRSSSRRVWVVVGVVAASIVAWMALEGRAAMSWRVVAAALLLYAMAGGRPPRARRTAAAALFVLLLVDLSWATRPYGVLRDIPVFLSNRYRQPQQKVTLPEGFYGAQIADLGPARIELERFQPRMATAPSSGGYRVVCHEPLVPRTWADLERVLTSEVGRGALLYTLDADAHARFFDLAGVRRILQARDGALHVEQNEDALPRAYLTPSYRIAEQDEAFASIRDGGFDFRRAVLLDRDPGFGSAAPGPLRPARIVDYRPERVVVRFAASEPSLLVLSDSHYPGWRARLGDEQLPVLLANGLYRAVPVPPGRHEVVFEYAPRSLTRGAALSGLSLAALTAVTLWLRRRGRQSSTGSDHA